MNFLQKKYYHRPLGVWLGVLVLLGWALFYGYNIPKQFAQLSTINAAGFLFKDTARLAFVFNLCNFLLGVIGTFAILRRSMLGVYLAIFLFGGTFWAPLGFVMKLGYQGVWTCLPGVIGLFGFWTNRRFFDEQLPSQV